MVGPLGVTLVGKAMEKAQIVKKKTTILLPPDVCRMGTKVLTLTAAASPKNGVGGGRVCKRTSRTVDCCDCGEAEVWREPA
jgi:hypothetical protein